MEAHQGSRPPLGGQRSTWIAFAGVMMVILGCLDVLWGIAAIANNEVVVVGELVKAGYHPHSFNHITRMVGIMIDISFIFMFPKKVMYKDFNPIKQMVVVSHP